MGSTFAGLSTALSGMYAARQGLDLTGQNVANANTEGYTRQRLNLAARGAPVTPAFFSTYDGPGNGVNITDIARLRDNFLERRAHTEHGRNTYLSTRAENYTKVEDIIAEPGGTGLQSQLSEFWNAWHDVANAPGDDAARAQLMQRSGTIVDGLHNAAAALETQWQDTRVQLEGIVAEVNTTAKAVAELNASIKRNTQAGLPVNELSDQRDLLIMKLADKTGAVVKSGDDGSVDVYVGGTALVRGSSYQQMQVSGAVNYAQSVATPQVPVQVTWVADGYPAGINLGQAAGFLEGLNTTIPDITKKLDSFTSTLVGAVNAVHATGYGKDGVTGRNFFSGFTAASINLAISSKDQVAAAGVPGVTLDGSKATAIAALVNDPTGPDAVWRSVVTQIGVDSQTAQRRSNIQSTIMTQVDSSREAESGVDIDEEMTNMLAYQHSYEGAARVLTAIDEALDVLVNRTGTVGR